MELSEHAVERVPQGLSVPVSDLAPGGTTPSLAQRSRNDRCSTNHQVVIDADTPRVVVVGRPVSGNRKDCKACEESGAKAAAADGGAGTMADGGYPGTGLVIPRCRERGPAELTPWKEEHDGFARMKTWKVLRDCRLRGMCAHHACWASPNCRIQIVP